MISKRLALVGAAGVAVVGWLVFGRGPADRSAELKPLPVPVTSAQVVARDVPLSLTGIGTVPA